MGENKNLIIYGIVALAVGFSGWYGYSLWQESKLGGTSTVSTPGEEITEQVIDTRPTLTQEEVVELRSRFLQGTITGIEDEIIAVEDREGSAYRLKINQSTRYLKFLPHEPDAKRIQTQAISLSDLAVGQEVNINLDGDTLEDDTPLATTVTVK